MEIQQLFYKLLTKTSKSKKNKSQEKSIYTIMHGSHKSQVPYSIESKVSPCMVNFYFLKNQTNSLEKKEREKDQRKSTKMQVCSS